MSSRTVTGISWVLLLAAVAGFGVLAEEALLQHGRGDVVTMTFTGSCAVALLLLEAVRAAARQRGRRQWRAGGGSAYSAAHSRRGTAGRVDMNASRLDSHDGELAEQARRLGALEAWQRQREPAISTVAGIVREAHEAEGMPVPAELQVSYPTLPLPPLWLAWDAERAEGA